MASISRFIHHKFLALTIIVVVLLGPFLTPLPTLVKHANASLGGWWNTNWPYRKRITIDCSKVHGVLADFPILIDVEDSDLGKAQSNGNDIVFTDSDGFRLNHEIEFYDGATGRLITWVNAPQLSSAANLILYMYYGNDTAENQQNPSATWNSNYMMVQHLKENSSLRYDSTNNGNIGTTYGSVAKISGKISRADDFNGTSGYVDISHSSSLEVQDALSLEAWIYRKTTNAFHTILGSGWSYPWLLRIEGDNNAVMIRLRFSDNTRTPELETEMIGKDDWYHIVATFDSEEGEVRLYVNGALSSTWQSDNYRKNLAVDNTKPFFIGCTLSGVNHFNGAIDEVRISNTARSSEWILTSYNNQQNPTSFYTLGTEENYGEEAPPIILDEEPRNGTSEVYTNPTLSICAIDYDEDPMNITFSTNATGIWQNIAAFINVGNGIYTHTTSQMDKLGTEYFWSVSTSDGKSWTNKTYSFTTTATVLAPKWYASTWAEGSSGVLIADVIGDGIEEVVHVGYGKVTVLSGMDGSVVWSVSDNTTWWWSQPQMADLDQDGILEIIVPLRHAGLLVLHANNGTTYWRRTGLGGGLSSSPVVADIDGDGYPTIFVASEDITHGLDGQGRVTALSYDGRILGQTFCWRACAGGLSIADTDNDGEFELYVGDRPMYQSDGGYGKGVRSFWAKNLTLRWEHPDILCSSHIPMLADVNKDGVLDVIVGHLSPWYGGIVVLNSTDGSAIRKSKYLGLPIHFQPSIADIDNDGNLEILMANGQYAPPETTDTVVFDLVEWKIDASINAGSAYYGPQIADVNGDGLLEIIVCGYKGIYVYNGSYALIASIAIPEETSHLNYAVVQDIDGDGYNEVVVSSQSGRVYAFDTPARRSTLRPRSEVQFYSERRLGVAEYVPPPGCVAPVISATFPSDQSVNVPVSLSQLSFNSTDYQCQLMNYTVTTSPDVGFGNGVNVPNGRYAITINGLESSTTYTWKISVTDGTYWTNMTLQFTTEPRPTWWNIDWQYRKAIVVDRSKVAAELSNFPVLIDITDSDLALKIQADGDDIVFTDANGVKLAHEVEFCNSSAGRLTAWVNVPLLSATTDTILYMYYGNPYAENQQNPYGVWDQNCVMVQHLEEASGPHYDSTSNNNTGTAYGGVNTEIIGYIDGADQFDGVNDRIIVPDKDSLDLVDKLTFEAWIYALSWGENRHGRILDKANSQSYAFYIKSSGLSVGFAGKWYTAYPNYLTLNTWHHVVVTFDRSLPSGQIKFFVDGILSGTQTRTASIQITSDDLYIGNNADDLRAFQGILDEIRVSNTSRSASWIQTSYNNQQDPTSFYTIGPEEKPPDAPVILDPSPSNEATLVPLSVTELSFNITDYQKEPMNYTVTTYPDVGSGNGTNVLNGRYTITINSLTRSTFYMWQISVTDGIQHTNTTFTFTTYLGEPPAHEIPLLISSEGNNKTDENLICYNQTTYDPEGDNVTNIYNWYKNNTSITNLLLPFDTNNSTAAKDYSGYGNDGITVRDVKWISNGRIGGAYEFNRGYIRLSGSNTLDGGGQWTEITVEHWIYLTDNQKDSRTIAKIPSYEIRFQATNKLSAGIWTAEEYHDVTCNTALNKDAWYHIAFTYKSGEGLTLYVNGLVVAHKTFSGNIQTSGTEDVYIGWFDYFKGIIDEVRIYPRSLSPQQIYQRYLETKNGKTNSSTIVPEETEVGDIWKCQVTPNDLFQDGLAEFSNSITIVLNNQPAAENLTITLSIPCTNDNLVVSYTRYDPEGYLESSIEVRYTYKNDALWLERTRNLRILLGRNNDEHEVVSGYAYATSTCSLCHRS